jgi:outer membrane protein assembly factor BamA
VKIVLLSLILAAPIAVTADEPRFLITRITVDGVRYASEDIVVAESRLRGGRSYSEAELRDAVARVERLPFILRAEFRLTKAPERGRYILVITAVEPKLLFFSAQSRAIVFDQLIPVPNPPGGPPGPPTEFRRQRAIHRTDVMTAGGRWFVGRKGVAHIASTRSALDDEDRYSHADRFSAGYTHYDLFGTRASVAYLITYQKRGFTLSEGFQTDTIWRPRYDYTHDLVLVVPIGANDSVRLRRRWQTQPASHLELTPTGFLATTRAFHTDDRELTWSHDTTDDPLLPSSGTRVSALVAVVEFAERGALNPRDFRVVRRRDYGAKAERYWAVTPRQSVSTTLQASDTSSTEATYIGAVGYSLSLLGRERAFRSGDFRFETTISQPLFTGNPPTSLSVNAGLVFRNSWGIVRLTVDYPVSLDRE